MNVYARIADFFVTNKKLSFLCLALIILWGGISFWIMPKQYNPDIVAPAFSIHVNFPDATVDEVYQLVTKPLEDVLNELPGVDNIYSTSVHGGYSDVVVEFYVGQDMHRSMIELRQKIDSRMNLIPVGVHPPQISLIDPEDVAIRTLALYSDKYTPADLRQQALLIKDRLRYVDGVSFIQVIGGENREYRIELSPALMQKSRTSLNEIEQSLRNTSILKVLGELKTEQEYIKIETAEQAATLEDIENIVVATNVERTLRIKDIAEVKVSGQEPDKYTHYASHSFERASAVYIAFSKIKGTNVTKVSKDIRLAFEKLKSEGLITEGIEAEFVKDSGRVASEEIKGLVLNLVQAIAIVFVVLLCFLNYRAAFIVAISIPLTLLTVFAVGNLCGYTINRITLFALILSLGMIVDSATVVIENIAANKKKYKKSKSGAELVSLSVGEVGTGLMLSTLTTVLAFVPMLFVTGLMGPYMGPLPFFVSTALIAALIFAYTLNPWLASVFCSENVTSGIEEKCGFVCNLLNKVYALYERGISFFLDNKVIRRMFLIAGFIFLMIVVTFPLFKLVRFRMLPKADREQFYVYLDLNRGSSLEKTSAAASVAESLLMKNKNVVSVQSFTGVAPVLDFNGLFKGVQSRRFPYQSTLKVNLTHPETREITSEIIAVQCRQLLSQINVSYPDAVFSVIEDPPGPPVRATYFLKIKSDDASLRTQVAKECLRLSGQIDGVKDLDISDLEEAHKYTLSVDKKKAADSKVSVDYISKELETFFEGKLIGIYHDSFNFEQEYIVVRFDRDMRDSIDDLEKIYIVNSLGNHVPISRFVEIKKVPEENHIMSDDRDAVVYVSGEMQKRSVTYAMIDFILAVKDMSLSGREVTLTELSPLSADFVVDGKDVSVEFGGEWQLTVEVFRDLGLAMLVAVVLIYMVLVAQFNSFGIPFLIMVTIPFSMLGVMPGFAVLYRIANVYFSATSMIGVIALAGIVVNNAIIYVEYLIQNMAESRELKEALIATGKARLRPIMLTSITTVLGSMVIASDPVWSGLSWAIIFGLSLSAVLTIGILPLLIYEFLGEKWFSEYSA